MRKTSELVEEMFTETADAWLVAIVIGFPDETKFVFSNQADSLQELNRFVKNGGFPIGLLRFEKQNGIVQGSYRPFEEYAKEDWVRSYLEGLLENTGDIVAMSQKPRTIPVAT